MAFMASDGARQFKVLLRKNLLLKTRRPCATCFEFLLPTVLFMMLAYIRSVYKLKEQGPFLFETAPIYPLSYLLFPEDASSQALVDMKTGNAPMIPGVHNGTRPTIYGSSADATAQWGADEKSAPQSAPSMYETLEREVVCMDGTLSLLDSAAEPLVSMLLGQIDSSIGNASAAEAGNYVASMLEQAQNGSLRLMAAQALQARETYLASEWKTDGEAWAVWLDAEFRKLADMLDDTDAAAARSRGEDYISMLCNSSLIPNRTRLGKHTNWSGTVSWSDRSFRIGGETVRWDEQAATFGNCTLNWVQRSLDCTGDEMGVDIDWSNHSLDWDIPGHNMSITWDDFSANFGDYKLDWTHQAVSWGDWSFSWSPSELNLTGVHFLRRGVEEVQRFPGDLGLRGLAPGRERLAGELRQRDQRNQLERHEDPDAPLQLAGHPWHGRGPGRGGRQAHAERRGRGRVHGGHGHRHDRGQHGLVDVALHAHAGHGRRLPRAHAPGRQRRGGERDGARGAEV